MVLNRANKITPEQYNELVQNMLQEIGRYGDEPDIATITTVKMVGSKLVCNEDPQEPFPLELTGIYTFENYKKFLDSMNKALKSVSTRSHFSLICGGAAISPLQKAIDKENKEMGLQGLYWVSGLYINGMRFVAGNHVARLKYNGKVRAYFEDMHPEAPKLVPRVQKICN